MNNCNSKQEQERLEQILARLEQKILSGKGTNSDWERLDRLSSANLREAVGSMDD